MRKRRFLLLAGIGNYIHYKKQNYRNYGTTIKGPNNYSDAISIFNQQKENIKNSIVSTKSIQLKDFEQYLNALMYPSQYKHEKVSDEIFLRFQKQVEEIFDKKFAQFGINWSNGSVYIKKIENKESISIQQLQNYATTLQNIGQQLVNKQDVSMNDINQLNSTIKRVQDYIKICQQNSIVKINNLSSNDQAKDIIAQINNTLQIASLPWGPAIGEVFEDFLAMAAIYAQGKSDQITDSLIKDILVGSTGRSKVSIQLDKFDSKFVDAELLKQSKAFSNKQRSINQFTNYEINLGTTQDKLDVNIVWNGDNLKISAKNYKLKDNSSLIHLVSGTSLLYMIQNENVDFINHWLNTITTSGKSDKIAKNYLQSAHTAMKITLFAKALTGQGLGRKGIADTFIVNNRTKKHIYVWNMKEVFDSCINNLDTIKFKNYPETISNNWVGSGKRIPSNTDAQQRISNLIAKVHTYKLSISISPKSLEF